MTEPTHIKDFFDFEAGIAKNDIRRVIVWRDYFCFVVVNPKILNKLQAYPTFPLCFVLRRKVLD